VSRSIRTSKNRRMLAAQGFAHLAHVRFAAPSEETLGCGKSILAADIIRRQCLTLDPVKFDVVKRLPGFRRKRESSCDRIECAVIQLMGELTVPKCRENKWGAAPVTR
jgi:hypothetical protein